VKNQPVKTVTRRRRAAGRRVSKAASPAERQDRILDAAHRLFRSQGYEQTGTREIAAAAGVGEGTIFYHFGSKSGLLDALGRRFSQQLRDDVTQGREPEELDLATTVARIFDHVDRFGLRHEQLGLSLDSPEIRHFMAADHSTFLAFCQLLLEGAKARGELKPGVNIEAAAELILSTISTAITAVYACGQRDKAAAYQAEATRLVCAVLK
jgi:AcrR family transcriptional regulator